MKNIKHTFTMKKHLVLFFALALGLTACNKTETFKVNVSLKNGNDETVYLQKFVDNTPVIVDSAIITNEMAVLSAPIDDPQIQYALKVKGKRGSMRFFADNKPVTIVGDITNPRDVGIMASETQSQLDAYYTQIQDFYNRMRSNEDAKNVAFQNEDYAAVDSLDNITNGIQEEMDNYTDTYFKEHADSFLAHYILDQAKHDYPLDQLKEIVASFTTESVYKDNINDYITKQERLEVGQPFIDFTLQTKDGENVTLSEIIAQNKLTLVDFWASWCGPCRHENPVVKAAYEQYHDLGFEVIGVSVDQDEAAWLKAVEADQLPYTQVRDSENTASEAYMIYYIPANFLFDQNGTMVAKGLRGEDLRAKLEELLK